MNSKVKAVLAVVAFVVVLVGLKFFYDSRVDEGNLGKLVPATDAQGDSGNTTSITTNKTNSTSSSQPEKSNADSTASSQAENSNTETVPLPDATLYTANGDSVKLSSFRGKKTIINAWASWCGPCKAEMPDFEELDQAAGDDYQILMVNIIGGRETKELAEQFLKNNDLNFTNMLFDEDMEFSQALQIGSIPTTIFVDEEGEIHIYQPGMLKKDQVLEGLKYLE